MVQLPHARLEEFLALPGITQGSVFWNAPDCEKMVFYRHLRMLNMVRIPSPAAHIKAGRAPMRMVVFRHYDPGTLAVTMPAMTPAQRARMMGPAQSVLLNAPGLGVLEAKRRADWPEPEKGPLTFNAEQMAEISAAMSHRSERKLMAYLRETLPDKAAPMDDATL